MMQKPAIQHIQSCTQLNAFMCRKQRLGGLLRGSDLLPGIYMSWDGFYNEVTGFSVSNLHPNFSRR